LENLLSSDISLYSLVLPRHVLYFILFLLPAIALCVAEELVVLISPCPLSAFNVIDYRVFQTSTLAKKLLEIKSEGDE